MRYWMVRWVCICGLFAFPFGSAVGCGGDAEQGDGGGGGVSGSGGSGGSVGIGGSGGSGGSVGTGGSGGSGGSVGTGGSGGTGGTGGGLSTTITITDLPSTDSDGSYTLTWAVTGLASSNWTIQEDDNSNFTSPTVYLSFDSSPPYTYAFSGKADGAYCYRVGLSPSGPFSDPACVTVTTSSGGLPSTPVITSSEFQNLNTVRLVWTDSDTETQYELESSFDNVTYTLLTMIPANETFWDINGLPPCSTTYFRLRAKNSQGYSSYYGSGPMQTDLTAIIDITTPSGFSPFIPGRYPIGCWSASTEQGGIGIYDDDGNSIIDNSHLYDFAAGSSGWVFPRVNVRDCSSCSTWHLEVGTGYQGSATLVLYFKFDTWSSSEHENYIAIHLNANASTASVIDMWGGDMRAWGIFPGIAMHNQVNVASVNGNYELPTASQDGYFIGNASGYISEVAADTLFTYDAGISIVDMNIPIRRD